MKIKDLENGKLLQEAILSYNTERSGDNLSRVIQLLRDSYVWVPCIAQIGEEDQKAWKEKVESGENLVGQILVSKEEIRFKPDILQSGENYFFPIFSNEEEMGEYGNGFSKIEMHFMEALDMALSYDVVGMVLDAFSGNFVIEEQFYELIMHTP